MVLRDFAGLEYRESFSGTVFGGKCDLVGGVFRAGWISRRYDSVRAAIVLVAMERGVATDLSAANYDRGGFSSRSERDFVFWRRTEAVRRHRFGRYHGVRLSDVFRVTRCFVGWRAGRAAGEYFAPRLSVYASRAAGYFFWKSRCAALCRNGWELGGESAVGFCVDADTAWDSRTLLWGRDRNDWR